MVGDYSIGQPIENLQKNVFVSSICLQKEFTTSSYGWKRQSGKLEQKASRTDGR
jgi:hypothetical protein